MRPLGRNGTRARYIFDLVGTEWYVYDRIILDIAHFPKYTRVYRKPFRTGLLERKLQMVQLSATRCSCIAILRVSLVSSAAVYLCVASQRLFIIVYFVIDSFRKRLNIPSYLIYPTFGEIALHMNHCPWRRFLLQELIDVQFVQKFLVFYRTRGFITVFTKFCHWILF
jgi:hypothetical protein